MQVESLHPVIPNFDSGEGRLEVYISEKYWSSFKFYRKWIKRISLAISFEFVSDDLQQVADYLLGWASASVGSLQIRLTLFALAIYSVMSRVVVSGYRDISEPGFPGTFSITFGDRYQIKPIE